MDHFTQQSIYFTKATQQSSEKSYRLGRSHQSPSLKSKSKSPVTPRIQESVKRLQNFLDDRFNQYNESSLLARFHDRILASMTRVPATIKNTLNINSFTFAVQSQIDPQHATDPKILELDLLRALKEVEARIIALLFQPEVYDWQKDDLGKRFSILDPESDPYQRFSPKMTAQFLEIMGNSVKHALNILYPTTPKLGMALENLWKALVMLVDFMMRWADDRSSQFVLQKVGDKIEECDQMVSDSRLLEEKLIKLIHKRDEDLKQVKGRFFSLQERFELLSNQYGDMLRSQEEDAKYIAQGGVFHLRRNVHVMAESLQQLNQSIIGNTLRFQTSIKNVGNAILEMHQQNTQFADLRKVLGINCSTQPPGDLAFGHLVSDHPWIPFMRISQAKDHGVMSLLEKKRLLHNFLMKPCNQKISPMWSLIESHNGNFASMTAEMYQIVQRHDQPYDQVLVRLFNLRGHEGLPLPQLNLFKGLYQRLELKLRSRLKADMFVFDIHVNPFEMHFGENEAETVILAKIEEREMSGIALICSILLEIEKQGQATCEQRVTNFLNVIQLIDTYEDLLAYSSIRMLCEMVFPEWVYLDQNLLLSYITWRHFHIQDEKAANSKGVRRSFLGLAENNPHSFMKATIQRIRTMLIYNPTTFDGPAQHITSPIECDSALMQRKLSVETPVHRPSHKLKLEGSSFSRMKHRK